MVLTNFNIMSSQTSIGTVKYVPEKNSLIWSIKQFPVSSSSPTQVFLQGVGFLFFSKEIFSNHIYNQTFREVKTFL